MSQVQILLVDDREHTLKISGVIVFSTWIKFSSQSSQPKLARCGCHSWTCQTIICQGCRLNLVSSAHSTKPQYLRIVLFVFWITLYLLPLRYWVAGIYFYVWVQIGSLYFAGAMTSLRKLLLIGNPMRSLRRYLWATSVGLVSELVVFTFLEKTDNELYEVFKFTI